MLKVDNLTELDIEELQNLWKRYGSLMRKLENGVLYTAIVDIVESQRDKDVVVRMAKMQNDVIEGLYREKQISSAEL